MAYRMWLRDDPSLFFYAMSTTWKDAVAIGAAYFRVHEREVIGRTASEREIAYTFRGIDETIASGDSSTVEAAGETDGGGSSWEAGSGIRKSVVGERGREGREIPGGVQEDGQGFFRFKEECSPAPSSSGTRVRKTPSRSSGTRKRKVRSTPVERSDGDSGRVKK